MVIKILLVDDHPLFLAGIRSFLAANKEVSVVGEARNGRQAVAMVEKHSPDIVIMDITMPDLNGIGATKEILSLSPNTKILALSIHTGKQFVRDMLDAGAAGYLLKDAAADELMIAIEKLAKGEMYLSSAITSTALKKDDLEAGGNLNILFTKLTNLRFIMIMLSGQKSSLNWKATWINPFP